MCLGLNYIKLPAWHVSHFKWGPGPQVPRIESENGRTGQTGHSPSEIVFIILPQTLQKNYYKEYYKLI